MSALWAPITGLRESLSEPAIQPRLRPVPTLAPRMARTPFVLVLIGLFGIGMAGLLMLNTSLQNQAFEARALNRQATELAYTEATLSRQVADLRAPQELALKASQMGMRPNPEPAFLVLPEGKLVGKPKRVDGNEVPSLIVKTPEQLAAEAAAAEAKRKAKAAEAKREAAAKAKEAAAKAKKDAAAKAKKDAAAKAKKDAAAKTGKDAAAKGKKDAAAKKAGAQKKQTEGRG
ncbi:hypothetical protein GCM10009841_16400 [Microlunatus panaciterrae]|uniref:Type IV secretory pathway VirB10-like protein n=1 Tax=Microlunatus panaciterrae TaxID=400768 RepID=A0ABS2RMG5_9ACTN|nr:hypothetical protein [Microlunatus panaciterrae]MBM7800199.1 type IV secretory pathway VirB10-like protein [Microlunatus panaciterrae]